jgi:amino acid adenylation domain-containing protein
MRDIQQDPIAIIGIGCRFPGACNPFEFWQLLSEGRNAIREVPADRWPIDAFYDPEPALPGKTVSRWGGFLDQVDQFDWRAFRTLPREVMHMDPQQRLLLEVAWEALEDAGIPFERVAGSRTGVFMGISWNDYFHLLAPDRSRFNAYTAIGNDMCFAANRLSYFFDLKGPSLSVSSGCTSSLMSVYQACQNLWNGEVNLALAGGVNLILLPDNSIMLSQAGLLARDGQCKTLDAQADGFVCGEGAGIVVLKRLSQVTASERVYALIRGIAANHNGHNEWIIATSASAQEALLRDAYHKAGVNPVEVDYIELNGTGFLQGDALEAQALNAVLGTKEQRAHACLIGSVKTNIGHLEAAAGIASLIKVALTLHHQQIPPTLNVCTTNPNVSWQHIRLATRQELSARTQEERVALAGVTTLSMSGANVHAVLAAPEGRVVSPAPEQSIKLLPVSACSAEALVAQATALGDFLRADNSAQSAFWQDVCYTASVGRTHHAYRLAITASSSQEAASELAAYVQKQQCSARLPLRRQKLVFLFTRSDQSARSIIEDPFLLAYPAFRATIAECKRVVGLITQKSLDELLNASPEADLEQSPVNRALHFIQQVALAALWRSWQIVPAGVLGEGTGEIAAAYIAGALTLENALRLIFDPEKPVFREIGPQGEAPSVILYASTVNVAKDQGDHLLRAAPLADAQVSDFLLDQVMADGCTLFLNLGLSSDLAARISARAQDSQCPVLLSTLSQEGETASTLLATLGTFYTLGYAVHWSECYPVERTCVSLPTYQWQRERFWPDWLAGEKTSNPFQEKIDESRPDQSEGSAVVPTDATPEQRIARIWQELLGLEQIGHQENFFALGGSSLLVGQLLARLHRLFRVELSMKTIFEHPTIAELAEIITQSNSASNDTLPGPIESRGQHYEEQLLSMIDLLTDEEIKTFIGGRETFTRLLQTKINGQKMFPLSFAQQRLWFLNQLQTGSPVYHVTVAFRLRGEINLQALEMSLHEIVRRHETLRTTFPALDGQPVQIIAPDLAIELVQENLEALAPDQQQAELLRLATSEIKKPFDLATGPLLRTRLLRLNAREHVLLFSVHHIVFDGWSLNIFQRELATLYDAFLQEKPHALPLLPIQYLDYTVWERKWFQSGALASGLAYWQQQLADALPVLDLPTDYPRPMLETFRGAYTEFLLPSSLLMQLNECGQREQVTLFMLLLTAFQVLLHYASGQDDIVVGTDVANRNQLEVENLIGFFVNQLVLRTNLSGDPSLSELLQRVRQVVLGAYEHQSVPFDQLVRALKPVRFPNRAPVFQAKIVLQNMSALPATSSITLDPLLVDAGAAQLDLILDVRETPSGLRAIWQYNTDLFHLSTIERMNRQFSLLLQAFGTATSQTVSALHSVLDAEGNSQQDQATRTHRLQDAATRNGFMGISGEDRQHVLHDFARGRHVVLKRGNLAREFEAQVQRTPHNIALLMDGRELTYARLNEQANRLAHHLQRWGIKPEMMVVLCTERSLETLIGMLGIFKAGGVCVSLDPTYPQERWSFILQDSQARVVVTQEKLASQFSAYELDVLNLDVADALPGDEKNLSDEGEPEHLAYVMYTSGSTGQPKGVAVSHLAALNHFLIMRQEFHLSEHDRILQFYSLSFDGSLEQVFPGLFCGATVVMRGPNSWSVAELNKAVVEQKLTVVNVTPALWQQWSQEIQMEPETVREAQLRLVIVGAEAMPLEALRRWRSTPLASCDLINAYGPTEAVITAATFSIPDPLCADEKIATVPIGKPLPDREIYLLDNNGQPVAQGATGEVYIGGPLLARGYLHRPGLTAERFLPNPFSSEPGTRFYKTGDLGRYLADGTLEYLGRVDHQVKIRGFRVEPGEIEAVLQKHPAARTAVVIVREDHPGTQRLVAYTLIQPDQQATAAELRTFLQERLPAYLLPSAFVFLETFPLTPNGKIDRRVLPAPETFRSHLIEAFVAPRNSVEEMVARIWSEVLAVDHISVHDNFFEIGGHSLIAIRVIARVHAVFQVDLPVHTLFLEPTIASFAAKIVEATDANKRPSMPAITRQRRNGTNTSRS